MKKEKQPKQTELEQRLRQIRAKIVASGEPLLNREIEQEIIKRRGNAPYNPPSLGDFESSFSPRFRDWEHN